MNLLLYSTLNMCAPATQRTVGTLLQLLDRRTEASDAFRCSIAVAPHHALAYNNLANGLKAAALC